MLLTRMIIELSGWPKKLIEESLKQVIKEISKRYKVGKKEFSEVKKIGKKTFSQFVEFECKFDNFESLFGMIIDFGPSVVEILEPDKIEIDSLELQNSISDMIARLKQINERMRAIVATNIILQREIGKVLKDKETKGKKTKKKR